MNSKKSVGSVELLLLTGLALIWAVVTIARLVLVPLVALLVVLVTPRRRAAPQPAVATPATASPEAPAPVAATVEEPAVLGRVPSGAIQRLLGVPAEPVLAAEPPVTLATIADGLMVLSAAELRRLVGTRAKVSKAELIGRLCAMPI